MSKLLICSLLIVLAGCHTGGGCRRSEPLTAEERAQQKALIDMALETMREAAYRDIGITNTP